MSFIEIAETLSHEAADLRFVISDQRNGKPLPEGLLSVTGSSPTYWVNTVFSMEQLNTPEGPAQIVARVRGLLECVDREQRSKTA